MMQPPLYRAVHSDKEPGFFEDDLPWQAQWYSVTSLNEDKYERGGWYKTEEEAIKAAKRGKARSDGFAEIMASGKTEWTDEELAEALKIEPMAGAEIVASGIVGAWEHQDLPDGGEWREEQQKKRKQRREKW